MPDTSKQGGSLQALRLTVNNHPGVMSHVCGLFARRAFNLEGIVVTPVGEEPRCHMWLLVDEDSRMEQVIRQVRKLHDVLDVSTTQMDDGIFEQLRSFLPA